MTIYTFQAEMPLAAGGQFDTLVFVAKDIEEARKVVTQKLTTTIGNYKRRQDERHAEMARGFSSRADMTPDTIDAVMNRHASLLNSTLTNAWRFVDLIAQGAMDDRFDHSDGVIRICSSIDAEYVELVVDPE